MHRDHDSEPHDDFGFFRALALVFLGYGLVGFIAVLALALRS